MTSVANRGLARAGLIVTVAFLASRLLGWLRFVVMSAQFPAQGQLDPYFAAFRIPDLIYQLVAAGAVGSALIPVLTTLIAEGAPRRAWRVASTVINLMLAGLVVFAVVVFIWAPQIVPVMTPGFDAAGTDTTIQLTRIMLLSPIFLALGALVSAILNSQQRFGIAAFAPVVYNLAIIIGCVTLGATMGLDGLALSVVIGSFLMLAVQLPLLRRRFHYDPIIDLRDPPARTALALMVPRAIGLGVTQITFVVNTTLATTLLVGSVTAYNLSFTILQIPLGVIGFPMGVVLLPSLSRAIALGDMVDFRRLVDSSMRLLLWVTLYISMVGIVLRVPTTELLFGNSASQVVALTASTYAWFLLGLPAHTLNVVLTRAFYSAKDTRTPVSIAICSVVVNVVVSVALVGSMGLAGLALGIALGGWFETVVLSLILWQRTHAVPLRSISRASVSYLAGALIAAGVAFLALSALRSWQGTATGRLDALVQLAVVGPISLASYLLYSRLMRIPELSQSVRLARSALHRG